MESKNNTNVPDFILMGLTDSEEIRWILVLLFLLIYLITVLGNAGMILIICLNPQLHTPMYFSLSHLSFHDLCYLTVITPKTLENLLTSNKSISFIGCFTQMYFLVFFGVTEFFFLSSMAFDCFVAICNPLQYPLVMSMRICSALITGSYMIGFTELLVIVFYMNSLDFCNSNVASHFFCDLTPILALSCTDTHDTEIRIFIFAIFNVVLSLTTISVSYGSILFTILKFNSSSEKHRAFSTCASHLLGVTIFYSAIMFTYLKPKNSYSLGKVQVASLFYTLLIPMLNAPFIVLGTKRGKMPSLESCRRERELQALSYLGIYSLKIQ